MSAEATALVVSQMADHTPGWRQLPRRPDLPLKAPPTPLPLRQLPDDIFALIADIHIKNEQFNAAGSLARANKAAFAVVNPRLYHCVKLHSSTALRAFYSQLAEWSDIRAQMDHLVKDNQIIRPRKEPKTTTAPMRKLDQLDRILLYKCSLRHLEIVFESTDSRSDSEERKWRRPLKNTMLKLELDSLTLDTVDLGRNRLHNLWLRAIFESCQAKHLRWRQQDDYIWWDPRRFMSTYLVPWASHPVLQSLDIPFWNKALPLEKARWLILGSQPRQASFLSDIWTDLTREDVSPQGSLKDVGPSEVRKDGKGPSWMIYNRPGDQVLGATHDGRELRENVGKLKQHWRINTHLVTDTTFTTSSELESVLDRLSRFSTPQPDDIGGDQWRHWLKRDIWGDAETQQGGEGSTSQPEGAAIGSATG